MLLVFFELAADSQSRSTAKSYRKVAAACLMCKPRDFCLMPEIALKNNDDAGDHPPNFF